MHIKNIFNFGVTFAVSISLKYFYSNYMYFWDGYDLFCVQY